MFNRFIPHRRSLLRLLLSHYVTNGVAAALGLLLISAGIHLSLGAFAAAAATVGVVVCIPPDQPAPQRGKFWQLLPAALLGPPLFFAVQMLHNHPLWLGCLLLPASFFAFLGAAWGKRGLPISVSIMFAMIFSMAVPPAQDASALQTTGYFSLGAFLYVIYATAANAALNRRYRTQWLADTLLSLANLLATESRRFSPVTTPNTPQQRQLSGLVLQQQANLADQLQAARDLILEAPRSPHRQQLAGMLMHVLEIRDHLLVVELDLDPLRAINSQAALFKTLSKTLADMASDLEQLADALLTFRRPTQIKNRRPDLAQLRWDAQLHWDANLSGAGSQHSTAGANAAALARGLANRVAIINDEIGRLVNLARGDVTPDLAIIRTAWQLFVSPTQWSWQPLRNLWHWDAPPLRHAIRAAAALGTAFAVAHLLPWGSHDYWILLTIVVVLRGSLAQTLERRNSRVAGTLIGCLLAAALLAADLDTLTLMMTVVVSQALAHAFAARRYLVTAISATVLGLIQASLLTDGGSPVFQGLERLADTLIGVAIAWPFSYLLPSWERRQIPTLLRRTLHAQAQHAQVALELAQLTAADNAPEIAWRLARRETYDSLSALAQATQRSLVEPRAIRPPLGLLELFLAQNYQLLAQLSAVKSMLLLRRGRLDGGQINQPLQGSALALQAALAGTATSQMRNPDQSDASSSLPDPFEGDLSPWLIRRLEFAVLLAAQIAHGAREIEASLLAQESNTQAGGP